LKKAICVFTKVPRVGDIKTRLTTEKGGILDPEEAKDFYEAVLLDVIDAAVACEDCDVYVVHNKTATGNIWITCLRGFRILPPLKAYLRTRVEHLMNVFNMRPIPS
jgi:2-phospho-L-lactate guanylyltransferase (CobY/MobA/RfbA family)